MQQKITKELPRKKKKLNSNERQRQNPEPTWWFDFGPSLIKADLWAGSGSETLLATSQAGFLDHFLVAVYVIKSGWFSPHIYKIIFPYENIWVGHKQSHELSRYVIKCWFYKRSNHEKRS